MTAEEKATIQYCFDDMYSKGEIKDVENGFSSTDDIKKAKILVNGQYKDSVTSSTSRQDIKMEFYNDKYARLVNVSGGITYTVPTASELNIDYSLAKYRVQIELGASILTVSAESSNPYSSLADPWGVYRDEWLLRWLNNDTYIAKSGLSRVEPVVYANTEIKTGYEVYMYAVEIEDNDNEIARPFYNIGIVRETKDPINFSLFVMKSVENRSEDLENILMSYSKITPKGLQKNYYDAGVAKPDPNWSSDTLAYYNNLIKDDSMNWGVFSYSMPGTEAALNPGNSTYDTYLGNSIEMKEGLESAWGHTFEIYPTYTHLSYGNSYHHFPLNMANELAGGDGKNGKPILQFTYQFTTDNNIVSNNFSPMFDILRGKYDDHFRKLAQDIVAYKKPILFRLNNEMNTDWTSYCGLLNLCDPDIFNMTWQRMYDVFIEEGVDNCIWIWNPVERSIPYSSWGEDLCYFPGVDYVQLLGLTFYEMNNSANGTTQSFSSAYRALYEKNIDAFSGFHAIISEFGCGSGGDATGVLGRNANAQAEWVAEMFRAINADEKENYIKQIVGAVWFNCDDVMGGKITNRLRIFDPNSTAYDDLSATIKAFKDGFNSKA